MLKIMKKYILCLITGLLVIHAHVQAYANEWSNAEEIPNVITVNSERQTSVKGIPRGRLISSVEIQLTDKGRGTAGIYADLLCHEPMEYLKMWLYLDKWDESIGEWAVEDSQQFTWLAKDYPDQNLTMAVVGYDISGLERGKDYRIRGLFGVKDLDSIMQESWSVESEALPLE